MPGAVAYEAPIPSHLESKPVGVIVNPWRRDALRSRTEKIGRPKAREKLQRCEVAGQMAPLPLQLRGRNRAADYVAFARGACAARSWRNADTGPAERGASVDAIDAVACERAPAATEPAVEVVVALATHLTWTTIALAVLTP